jgi:protein-tyrosine-phosphatase
VATGAQRVRGARHLQQDSAQDLTVDVRNLEHSHAPASHVRRGRDVLRQRPVLQTVDMTLHGRRDPRATAPPRTEGRDVQVLVLCTANRCRSPLGEHLLAQAWRDAAQQDRGLVVRSAGLLPGGSTADPLTAAAGAELGVDLTGHVSRQLDKDMLRQTDLLIAMERRHLREAAVLHPPVLTTAFTLPELVRRGRAAPRRPPAPVPIWLRGLATAVTCATWPGPTPTTRSPTRSDDRPRRTVPPPLACAT